MARPQSDFSVSPETTAGYERSDVSARSVAKAAIIVIVSLLLVALGMHLLFGVLYARRLASDDTDSPFAGKRPPPPEPWLQVAPATELAEVRRYERELLHQYRWIDEAQGVIAIPIDRAIDLLVERDSLNRTEGNDATP